MSNVNMFARITKVDEARREVWGRAAAEVVDRVDEVFDYEKSKPYFEAWSKEFSDATDGKSLGNIRAMHGKVAAGKAIHLDFNDTEKAIDIGAKIVDDAEWAKVLEGVYTGFSIGGSYVGERVTEKVDGRDVKRYTAKPAEISIVDSPCIPTAKFFDVIKSDGKIEKVAFKPAPVEVKGTDEDVAKFGAALNAAGLTIADAIVLVEAEAASRVKKAAVDTMLETLEDLAKRDFSAEERKKAAESGHALPDGSFPINTVSDLENAIHAYGRAKDKEKAKAHIIARAKALGASDKLPEDWGGKATPAPMQKDLADMLAAVELKKRLTSPDLPFAEFVKIAQAELTAEEFAAMKTSSVSEVTAKILAKKVTGAHKDSVQAIHDHAVTMGADCDNDTDKSDKGDLAKGGDIGKQLSDALARIKALEAQPMPHVVTLRTVQKTVRSVQEQDVKDALAAMPYEKLTKFADGTIDWKSSERLLEQSGAA
jgi:hypothetical protein